MLDAALTKQKNDILSVVKEQLGSISSAPFSTIKRKADQFSNEGLKKQFTPLEEAKLRQDAVRSTMAGVAERTSLSSSLCNRKG
jgi:DNA recombination-dependent growth factor C